MRLLGLTSDARVHISAPGIDVVITGEPDQVRALLSVVKYELERSTRWKDRDREKSRIVPGEKPRRSQLVQPTELDEMDSPYAFSEALVMPVDEITDERDRQPASRKASQSPAELVRAYEGEPATLVPDVYETRDDPNKGKRIDARPMLVRNESPPQEVSATKIDSKPPVSEDEPEKEVTAVSASPSGPTPSPDSSPAIIRSNNPFITDGGPTLTPSASDSDVKALRRGDVEEDTKETPRS
jgi:hypothetical protein